MDLDYELMEELVRIYQSDRKPFARRIFTDLLKTLFSFAIQDNIAERECCGVPCKCIGTRGDRGGVGLPGSKVLQNCIFFHTKNSDILPGANTFICLLGWTRITRKPRTPWRWGWTREFMHFFFFSKKCLDMFLLNVLLCLNGYETTFTTCFIVVNRLCLTLMLHFMIAGRKRATWCEWNSGNPRMSWTKRG